MKKLSKQNLPVRNFTWSEVTLVIWLRANEPLNRCRLIGDMDIVGISFFSTYEVSIKQSVEPESRRDLK